MSYFVRISFIRVHLKQVIQTIDGCDQDGYQHEDPNRKFMMICQVNIEQGVKQDDPQVSSAVQFSTRFSQLDPCDDDSLEYYEDAYGIKGNINQNLH